MPLSQPLPARAANFDLPIPVDPEGDREQVWEADKCIRAGAL